MTGIYETQYFISLESEPQANFLTQLWADQYQLSRQFLKSDKQSAYPWPVFQTSDASPSPSPTTQTTSANYDVKLRELTPGQLLVDLPTKQHTSESDEQICAICFSAIHVGQRSRHLKCFHQYHPECIDRWLIANQDQEMPCPLCRRTQAPSHLEASRKYRSQDPKKLGESLL